MENKTKEISFDAQVSVFNEVKSTNRHTVCGHLAAWAVMCHYLSENQAELAIYNMVEDECSDEIIGFIGMCTEPPKIKSNPFKYAQYLASGWSWELRDCQDDEACLYDSFECSQLSEHLGELGHSGNGTKLMDLYFDPFGECDVDSTHQYDWIVNQLKQAWLILNQHYSYPMNQIALELFEKNRVSAERIAEIIQTHQTRLVDVS